MKTTISMKTLHSLHSRSPQRTLSPIRPHRQRIHTFAFYLLKDGRNFEYSAHTVFDAKNSSDKRLGIAVCILDGRKKLVPLNGLYLGNTLNQESQELCSMSDHDGIRKHGASCR